MRSLYAVLCLSILLIVLNPVSATPPVVYTESFLTTTYEDPLENLAWWDTVKGQLKLYPFGMTLLGGYDPPGTAWGVHLSADRAYVASWGGGLQILDISEPSNPLWMGDYNTNGNAVDVVVEGKYAFVAAYDFGLEVIDVSSPNSPTFEGDYNTPGYALAVDVSGDYAYIADRSGGLQVISILNPSIPVAVGSYVTSGQPSDVSVVGDVAYVADQLGGLAIIDVSSPASPSLIGSYTTPTYCYGVGVAGQYAYLACYSSGLIVVDVSDLANPVQASTVNTPGLSWKVDIDGDFVYVADGTQGIVNIDITNPTAPVLKESFALKDWAYDIAVAGEFAYVADRDSGLQVVHVAQPIDPPILVGSWNTPSLAWAIDVDGDHAYVGDNVGLEVVDISDPGNPVRVGFYDTPGPVRGVVAAGDLLYLCETDLGDFEVVDVSDRTNPTRVGYYNTLNTCPALDVAGDHAFVVDFDGMFVIDVSDPTNPNEIGSQMTSGFAQGIAVEGDFAYIADGSDGLQIFNISTPAIPLWVGDHNGPGSYVKVAVDWPYAYVAAGASGLQIIDVSDPVLPVEVGVTTLSDITWGLTVEGDFAFIAEGTNSGSGALRVVDIRDPFAPAMLSACYLPDDSRAVVVDGNHAYVANDGGGLQVCQVFERGLNLGSGRGQSLFVYNGPDTVRAVRVNSDNTGDIYWYVDTGNTYWHWLEQPGTVRNLLYPGDRLRWRCYLPYTIPGVNPICSDLSLELIFDAPSIYAIADIPNDQGKQARIRWTRSGHDAAETYTQTPVTEYSIFRKIDWGMTSAAAPAYPPGDWEFVKTVPAYGEDDYTAVVPTLKDSTIAEGMYRTTFFVRAATASPTVHFDSEPDSGYSLDNLAPSAPTSFAVAYNSGGGTQLSWDECPDGDFDYFRIYRGTTDGFTPDPGNLLHATVPTGWLDTGSSGGQYYYKITAVDFSGNESDASGAGSVTGAGDPPTPAAFALHQNVPNPFNPSTAIAYDVPEAGGAVTLRVYDASGRLVRTLVDGVQSPGRKYAQWDGRDGRGAPVASGVYFYRLSAPGFDRTHKMLLLK